MQRADFSYELPEKLIAYHPAEQRTHSRLFLLNAESESTAQYTHQQFSDLIHCLQPHDLLVLNNTRVMSARLYGKKPTGGKIEVLIERVVHEHEALAHIKASKSPKPGSVIQLTLDDQVVDVIVKARVDSLFVLEFPKRASVWQVMEAIGHMPLPPYIKREDELNDAERYQTVYAKNAGAVAAPTAGLHFDEALLQTIVEKQVDIGYVTLHVGAGTFQPVRVDNIKDHHMHSERILVDATLCEKIKQARAKGGRVVAVGTTVVRCLESAAIDGEVKPFDGDTNIFINPGYRFKAIDALITNFHLSESTLLMLVSAFAGYENIMQAYQEAIKKEYRFFSYGDAMFLKPPQYSLHYYL